MFSLTRKAIAPAIVIAGIAIAASLALPMSAQANSSGTPATAPVAIAPSTPIYQIATHAKSGSIALLWDGTANDVLASSFYSAQYQLTYPPFCGHGHGYVIRDYATSADRLANTNVIATFKVKPKCTGAYAK